MNFIENLRHTQIRKYKTTQTIRQFCYGFYYRSSWTIYWFQSLHCIYQLLQKKHSIATITKLRSLELLIKTPLLHILYYINGLTHDFCTRTGGWEFYRSHGAGTSSPSHWQQVEEQAPKPMGWTMCFLLMTLVPIQKLCVNIYVYICVYIPYTSSVISRIYNGSVLQYWRSCTPSRSIGECAVPGLNAILCFLWFTNCVLLFDKNLILGCLWHMVFV